MKKSIMHNLSWLLICSVVAKILGGAYRIVLTRILGANIGLYQMVFSAYSFLVILCSSGVSLAVSKLVSSSKSTNSQQNVVSGVVAVLFTFAGVLTILLILGGKGLALLQGDGSLSLCYIILAPSLILSAGVAILKGYLQGVNDFHAPALSGVIEQITKVVLGLIFMLVLRKYYLLGALFGAMLGTLAGDMISFVYLKIISSKSIKFNYSINHFKKGQKAFKYALPILIYSLLMPLSNFVDSFLVVNLLKLRLSQESATLLYGLQTGAVNSIISIPNIFSFALVSVLMPTLSMGYGKGEKDNFCKTVNLAYRLAIWVALPCAIFFAINSRPIIKLLYGTRLNGYGVNGQYVSSLLLMINSISIIFSCFGQISAVILQSTGNEKLPIINLLIGISCKLILELMFVPAGRIGVVAYALANIVCIIVSSSLNLYAVEKYCCKTFEIKSMLKIFACGSVLILSLTIFKIFESNTMFVLGTIFSIIVYLISCYLIKLFNKKEINYLINK